jgi:SEFIR domain
MEENTVFISYSHDSIDHMRNVMSLCSRLRHQGVDCMIDQFVTSPDEGWPLWMERQIQKSEFILVVCTHTYYQRFMGQQPQGSGLGARWEGHLTLQQLYNNGAVNTKFIPILMGEENISSIPLILQSATYYRPQTEEGYEKLYRHLTHQPLYKKPTLGEKKELPSLQIKGDFLEGNQSFQGFKNIEPEEFKGVYQSKSSIEYRHLTGLNSYPVLALSEKYIPKELTDILGIEGQPIINTDSVVFENLEKFIIESGNSNLIKKKYHPLTGVQFSYAVHNSGNTKSGRSDWNRNLRRQDEFEQSYHDFLEDTVQYTSECQEFEFSTMLVPFQDSQEDLDWTSITIDQYDSTNGDIFQYPRFSEILNKGLEDFCQLPHTSKTWITKILIKNPNLRGFFLYKYQYTKAPRNAPRGCGLLGLVTRISPAPYVRFVEIKNISDKTIRINKINYKIFECDHYQITDVDDRSNFFDSSEAKIQDINLDINPNQHLFILTEFGFDTKNHDRSLSYYKSKNICEEFDENKPKKIFIHRPQTESVSSQESFSDLLNRYNNYSEAEDSKENPLYDIKIINKEFLDRTKNLDDLISQKSRRFAVGSIVDILSIDCSNETILVDRPKDLDAFYISQYFAYGSCPYLLVYDECKKYWIELGTILYGRDTKKLNDFEVYSLPLNTSKIRIEERDPENTYIHHLSILIYPKNCDSPEKEMFPNLSGDFNQYDNHFSLDQGGYVEFDIPSGNEFDFKLKIKGYYEILSLIEA